MSVLNFMFNQKTNSMKKNESFVSGSRFRHFASGTLRMLLTVCCLGFFNTLIASQKIAAQERVSLNVNNVSLVDCFMEIQRQTGVDFVYNEELCKGIGGVTLQVVNEPLESVLSSILANSPLEYRFEGGMIVIRGAEQPTVPQEKSVVIEGTVSDQNRSLLPGATVAVKGSTWGVATDERGRFRLEVPAMEDITLVFSFIGMKSVEVKYEGKPLTIILEDESTALEEAVVEGLFVKPRESYTGAAVKITQEELKTAGNRNILQSLSNIDPSFVLVEDNINGSNPNALPEIRMRGVSSIPTVQSLQNSTRAELNTPLFLLDGFEITLEQMMDLNNDEIESITLLKDASATAMYGSRGANGVVLITSIKPEAGRLKVSYNGNVNLEIPALSSYDLLNAREKLQLEWDAGIYNSDDPVSDAELKHAYAEKLSRILAGVDTDWLSIPVRVGIGQSHYASLSGGDQHFRFNFGLSYNQIKGAMKGSDRSTLNGSVRLSYLTKKFSFNNNTSININRSDNGTYGGFSSYVNMNPYYEPYDSEGLIVKQFETSGNDAFPTPITNPLYNASLNSFSLSKYTSFTNNFSLTYNPLKTLRTSATFSYSTRVNQKEDYTSPLNSTYFNTEDLLTRGERSYSNSDGENWEFNFQVNYNNTWKEKHIFTAGFNYSIRESISSSRGMKVEGFINEAMNDLVNAQSYKDTRPSSSSSTARSIGLAATVNYSYDNRYYMDLSYRRDGASSFGSNSRWAPFYSLGAGWNINQEPWIKEHASFLTLFRIKYSYGVSGSMQFDPSQSLGTYTLSTTTNFHGGVVATIDALENPDLKWQNTFQHNIGLDFSLFENRFSITGNWYRKITKNSVTDMAIPLSNGFKSYVGNEGDILNTGFDLSLSLYLIRNARRGISWNVRFSTSHNKNKLLTLSDAMKAKMESLSGNQIYGLFYVYGEGESIDAIYAVRTVGVDPSTGKVIYLYKDGTQSYKFDQSQRVVVGDRMPKVDGRISTSFIWKNLSVYAGFTLRLGGQKYNETYRNKVENVNLYNNVDKRVFTGRWSKPGDNAIYYGLRENNTYMTDRYIQDESTLSCNNLSLTYNFPNKLTKKWGFERLSVNASISNLFYISTVKQERGTSYPYAIQPTFGISCAF